MTYARSRMQTPTAMQRTAHRIKKQQQGVAATRVMGVVSGACAPASMVAVGGATGMAIAAFLGFAGLFLLVSTAQ